MSTLDGKKADYETRDVAPMSVLLVGAGLLAAVALSMAFVLLVVRWVSSGPAPASSTFATEEQRSGPRLEVSPSSEAALVRQLAEDRLEGYGWTDRATGQGRIPIGRAMAILAERGWPDRDDRGETTP